MLARVAREIGGHALDGILECPRHDCRREYPIVDGLPILLRDLRAWVEANLQSLLIDEGLSIEVESLLGDCCGPTSALESVRQHRSTYAHNHYQATGEGSLTSLVERARSLAPLGEGPVLDLGCAVGGASFALAADGRTVVGGDLHVGLARTAARLLRQGSDPVPYRRVGAAYDRVEVVVDSPRDSLDFWLMDALDLPFADHSFGGLVAFNLVDCVRSPVDAVREIGRVLQPGGIAWLASPYDWSVGATPFEGWIGGHSQRGEDGGAAEPRLRGLLTPEVSGLEIVAEDPGVPWRLRIHDRSVMEYSVDLLAVRRVEPGT